MVFKSGDTSLTTDSVSLFPATTDFIYGFASGSASAVRVDGYGETAVTIERYASDGSSNTSGTLSTTGNYFAGGTDFTGPSNRFKSPKAAIAFSIADSDGGEKTSFVPRLFTPTVPTHRSGRVCMLHGCAGYDWPLHQGIQQQRYTRRYRTACNGSRGQTIRPSSSLFQARLRIAI